MKFTHLFATFLVGLALAGNSAARAGTPPVAPVPVSVSDAWVRANAPGLDVTAAYLKIRNSSRRSVQLVGISTPAAAMASMHITVIERGVSSMREVPMVKIAAGEVVQFEPGGMHVMLMGLVKPLRPGTRIRLRLELASGAHLDLDVPVRTLAGT